MILLNYLYVAAFTIAYYRVGLLGFQACPLSLVIIFSRIEGLGSRLRFSWDEFYLDFMVGTMSIIVTVTCITSKTLFTHLTSGNINF